MESERWREFELESETEKSGLEWVKEREEWAKEKERVLKMCWWVERLMLRLRRDFHSICRHEWRQYERSQSPSPQP